MSAFGHRRGIARMLHYGVATMRSRFVALTLIWGASFLFIKIGVQSLAPIQVAFARMLFGSLTLLAFIAARRDRLPREPRLWLQLALAAALLNVVPFTLFAYAQRHVPSALASIGNATTPLWTGLFALFILPDERPTVRRALGLMIGFAGVMVVLGAWRGLAAAPDLGGMLLIDGADRGAVEGAGGGDDARRVRHRHRVRLALWRGARVERDGGVDGDLLHPHRRHPPGRRAARRATALERARGRGGDHRRRAAGAHVDGTGGRRPSRPRVGIGLI